MNRVVFSLAAAVVLLGCADKTGILVEVTSDDLSIPGDIDHLRFHAVSTGGHATDQTFEVSGDWPQSLTIVPAGTEDGGVTITVIGLHGGDFQAQRAVQVPFEPGTTRHVTVVLTRDCLGLQCGDGVDCVGGACVGVDVDAGMIDAGPRRDAGPRDGGGTDAGRIDAGPIDAGPFDAGTDAGPFDAGPFDAGPFDAGPLDAGPPDAGPIDAGPYDAGPDAGPYDAGPIGPVVLYFSEYVEGTSLNKYVEIYNATNGAVSLAGYSMRVFHNGSTTPGPVINLTGTVARHGVYVVGNSGGLLTGFTVNQSSGSLDFSGNDAVVLFEPGGTQVDIIGVIGDATTFGQDKTFVRNSGTTMGRAVGNWDPTEWTQIAGVPVAPVETNNLGMYTP